MNVLCLRLALASWLAVPILADSGTLKVLSYNVAGLPAILSSSSPEENTPYISARLSGYNIINVQEDFNYHAALYASDKHAYRTPTSGGVPFGDGLNTLSDFEYIDFERTAWTDCNLNSGDCLTPKGFTAMRVRLSANQWIDVYNLHTDAGSDSGDLAARQKNLNQVLAYLNTYSAGMPVLVMGDTNTRYTTIGDGARTLTNAGFTDAWVSIARSGSLPAQTGSALTCPFPFASGVTQAEMLACEVVDKIWFRRGTSALSTFEALSFTNEHKSFLHPTSGAPLSDHYPISANIYWDDSASKFKLSDLVGGPHGNYYNDVPALQAVTTTPKITTITIAGGSRVDSVTAAYSNIATIKHGGTGGTAVSLTLASGEGIMSIYACEGQEDGRTRVFYLKITTNTGRSIAVGATTSACKTLTAPSGFVATGFWGRSGDEVDRIGVVWGK